MADLNVEFVTADDEVGQIIHQEILDQFCPRYVLVGEERTCLAEEYLKFAEQIKNFDVRDRDVWVTSYPKAGTTWTQEMVWLIANDVDFKGAEIDLYLRFPFLEGATIMNSRALLRALNNNELLDLKTSIDRATEMNDPRFIKSHMPFYLLPDQIKNGSRSPKIIYVMRNPKDVCVSYYHHGSLLQGWRTNVENFAKVFLADKAQYGSFWKHVLGYWNHRHSHNILFLKYEDMKADLVSVMRQVANFLGKTLTNEQIAVLCEHLSFASMKKNKSLNVEDYVKTLKKNNLLFHDGSFFRSGIVDKYKEELLPETIEKFDVWTKKSIAGTSIENEYEQN